MGDVVDKGAGRAKVQGEETRAAQRGFFLITGAKIWFLIAGTILNIGLPRFLGDPARFGDFAVVNTLISIVNMVVIFGAVQVVAKRVSETNSNPFLIRKNALRLMLLVGGSASLLLALAAQPIATTLFRDESLTGLILIGAVIPVCYGLYGALLGLLNGLKLFARQALFDVTFATLKVAFMVGLVMMGFGVSGAFTGFAAAAALIMVIAFAYTRRLVVPGDGPNTRVPMARFLFQVMGYTLFINILVQADVLVLKYATYQPALDALSGAHGQQRMGLLATTLGISAQGLAEMVTTESTAMLSGFYRATKNVSLISYQAVIAITFVIFPLISRSTFDSDAQATRTYVRQTVRAATLIVVFVATMIAAGDEPLLTLLFGDVYALAAPALLPLVAAMAAFALLFVVGNILTAGGRPMAALGVAGLAACLQLGALVTVVGAVAPTPDVLRLSGVVSLVAITLPLGLACGLVYRCFQAPLPWASVVRSLAAAGLALLAVSFVSMTGFPGLFVRCALACAVFVGVIVLGGELTPRERALVGRLVKRS